MTPYITRALAQQIVDTVRDLCGQNVNFIDCSGTIFASTDESRIGTFHEIGREAAASGSVIEVRENDHFTGTQQGGNLPGKAAVGIEVPNKENHADRLRRRSQCSNSEMLPG